MTEIIKLPTRPTSPLDVAVRDLNEHAAIKLREEGKFWAAITATKRAIHIAPNSRELWANLGAYFWHVGQIEEAEAALNRSLAIDNNYYLPYANLALIKQDQEEYEQAEGFFAKALELNPDYLLAQWCRGLMRLAVGDYAGGFADYEKRIRSRMEKGKMVYPQKFPAPYWHGENLRRRTIYVASEQGIGGNIFFSRFLPLLAKQANRVYYNTSETIQALLWNFRSCVTFIPSGVPIPQTDYACVIGSLPHYLGVKTVVPDPGIILRRAREQRTVRPAELRKAPLDDAFKVGICWTGNPAQSRNHERTIPFRYMLDLAANPKVWLYSLQVGDAAQDIYKEGGEEFVLDLGPQLWANGLPVTADAMLQLDLVVTCCTSVAHLAGALGIPAVVVLCADPFWIWGVKGETTPWYPKLKLFRQKKMDQWDEVMREVQQYVHALANKGEVSYG